MPHRRATAPVAVLVLLLGGALSACGFDAPTDRINTIAAGSNERSAQVDALGIRVLSARAGEGRLIGSLANNTGDDAALTDVSGEGISLARFRPVTVAGSAGLNLASDVPAPVLLTGEFAAGQVLTLDLTFDTGETVTLDVPVVKYCGQYTQIPEPVVDPGSADEETPEGDATYLCEHPHDDEDH